MNRKLKLSQGCVAVLLFSLLAGCGHSAAVAVNPITNQVTYTVDDKLNNCDAAVQNCQPNTLSFKPVDAAFTEGGIVFISKDAVYRCDTNGQGCSVGIKLSFSKDAVGVYAQQGGQVVVISSGGELNLCGANKCEKTGK